MYKYRPFSLKHNYLMNVLLQGRVPRVNVLPLRLLNLALSFVKLRTKPRPFTISGCNWWIVKDLVGRYWAKEELTLHVTFAGPQVP